jgi:hypothetical protein
VGVVNKNQNRERNLQRSKTVVILWKQSAAEHSLLNRVSTPELLVTRSEFQGVNAWRAVLGSRARIGLAIRAP